MSEANLSESVSSLPYYCNTPEMDGTFPSEPGWYWYKKYRSWDASHWKVVRIDAPVPYAMSEGGMQNGWNTKLHEGEWYGPIPPPAENVTGEASLPAKENV